MAKLRLRHPKGVVTIDIDLENATVQDLQQKIREQTNVLPSQQDLKAGYPPHQLTLIPELPVSSLGLANGDQIILTTQAPASSSATTQPTVPAPQPVRATTSHAVPRQGAAASGDGPDHVQTEGGVLVHRIVPDDNSCLFNAIALVFEQDIGKAQQIRKIVADAIRKDPINWDEAILGRPRDDYISTILKPSSWGGAIELAILATHYNAEIASIDVETGRIDKFQPSAPAPPASSRCVLIYSGIHYDAASLAPMVDAPADFHTTVFPLVGDDAKSDPILRAAGELAGKLRAKRAYTNTATFDLKCLICKKGLKGEKEARAHASETGHTSFGEY